MKLVETVLSSSCGGYSRKAWLLDAGLGAPQSAGIFLDGEYYLKQMDAPAILTRLQSSGIIPPMLCLFVSHRDGEARHHDYTCSERYSQFIAADVFPWLRERAPGLPGHGHLIAGPSLGGLAAAHLALTHPELFSRCLSHSGSFWWNGEWLRNSLDREVSHEGKFWLSVGSKETEAGVSHPPTGLRQDVCQISACQRLAAALAEQGHTVHYEVYEGGHEIKPWQDELPAALTWLLANPQAFASEARVLQSKGS